METISKPATIEETVTDLDIAFSSGEVKEFTLRSGDSYDIGETTIRIVIVRPPEQIFVNIDHVAFYSVRTRVVVRPAPLAPKADLGVGKLADAPKV